MPVLRTRTFALCLSLFLTTACSDETTDDPAPDSGVGAALPDGGQPPKSDAGLVLPGTDGGFVTPTPTPSTDGGSVTPTPTPGSDGGSTPSPTPSPTGGFIRGDMPTEASASKDGPYKVGNTTMGLRDGPAYADATLYWPTDATPPFASVVVIPGFVSAQSDIQQWGPFLASHGIVALTIGTNSGVDQPPARADALLDALATIRAENTRAMGPVNGKLDETRQAIMGWSMGGGGTLIAANKTPSLKAAISMCGYTPGTTFPNITVPTLLLASQGDPLAGGQSQPFYASIPAATPKELLEMPGGDHYLFNTPKNLSGAVGRYGLSWLKVFLEGDTRYRDFLKVPLMGNTDFKTNVQ